MLHKHVYFWFWAISLGVILSNISGCKPSKKLVSVDIPEKSVSELNHALKDQSRDYEWLTLKTKLKYKDNWQSIGGTLYVKAKKDSIIWMRVTKFGFEGARVRITPQQIEVINRIDKTYEKRSLKSISKEYGVALTFTDIENMIIGNPLFQDNIYKSSEDSTGYILTSTKDDIEILYHLLPIDLFIDKMEISQYRQGQLTATYENYEPIESDEWYISKKRDFYTEEADGSYKSIGLKITSSKLNKPSNIIFSIPSHYEHIP